MRFKISRASEWPERDTPPKDISTLDELLAFIEAIGFPIVIEPVESHLASTDGPQWCIIIYDGYLE